MDRQNHLGSVDYLEGRATDLTDLLVWRKPRGCSFIHVILSGKGGSGGTGYTRGSGLTKGGGGGGGPSAVVYCLYMAHLFPDLVYLFLPGRDATVTPNSYIFYACPNFAYDYSSTSYPQPYLISVTGGNAGANGTSSAGGATGSRGTSGGGDSPVDSLGVLKSNSIAPNFGTAGTTTNGTNVTSPLYTPTVGGAGGAGGTTGTGTTVGGGFVFSVDEALSVPGSGPSVNPAVHGRFFGQEKGIGLGFGYGGNGGGANLGSGAGAAGGDGAPGCGGGGGGAGVSAGGAGGKGGPGFAYFICY